MATGTVVVVVVVVEVLAPRFTVSSALEPPENFNVMTTAPGRKKNGDIETAC